MDDERLPKRLFYGDVATGSRRQGGQIRRYKDTLKSSLKRLQINPTNWEDLARDCPTWRRTVKTGAAIYEANRIAAAKAKREARKSLRPIRNAAAQPLPTCPRCQRTFRARIGLVGHLRINCTSRTAPAIVPQPASSSSSLPPTNSDNSSHLPPTCESSSSGSDWASSGDEWRPSPSPSSSSSSANSKSARILASSPASDPNAPTDLPVPAKTCHAGTLIEDKSAGIQSIKREMEEPDRKETLRDPEDDRYLYCYECECMVLDACEKHPNMWIENVVVDDCEATSKCDFSRCSCLPDKVAHAKNTAPSEYVSVRPSSIQSAGLGVWSEREIPLGTVCGPYSGEIVYLHSLTPDELDARVVEKWNDLPQSVVEATSLQLFKKRLDDYLCPLFSLDSRNLN
nr:unnamed protein product [Spirometra erinaceieuropaei]